MAANGWPSGTWKLTATVSASDLNTVASANGCSCGSTTTSAESTFTIQRDNNTPSVSYNVTADDMAGPRYRKIALNGRPLPDEKPQASEETDEAGEETYVDGFTHGLVHETSDIYIPLASSELVLTVRRSLQGASWNQESGLRPQERRDQAFGTSWSSNLACAIEFSKTISTSTDSLPQPYNAVVTDENGATRRFATYRGGAWYPVPSGVADQGGLYESLVDNGTTLTYTRKFGNRLTFEKIAYRKRIMGDRAPASAPSGCGSNLSVTDYSYARLTTIQDRYGNQLFYEYPDASSLVPSRIHDPLRGQQLTITSIAVGNYRRVTEVTDPRGNKLQYAYVAGGTGYYSYSQLASVTTRDAATNAIVDKVEYNYTEYTFPDQRPAALKQGIVANAGDAKHLNLTKITTSPNWTAATPTKWSHDFTYVNYASDLYHETRVVNSLGSFTYKQNSRPRRIANVTQPDGSKSYFYYGQMSGTTASPSLANRATVGALSSGPYIYGSTSNWIYTTVVDSENYKRYYTFKNLAFARINAKNVAGTPVPNPIIDDPRHSQWVVYSTETEIDYAMASSGNPASQVKNGQEIERFLFNVNAGMALGDAYALSGPIGSRNRTQFTYASPFSPPPGYLGVDFLTGVTFQYFNDPTSQIDAQSRTKSFQYGPYRQMSQITDELGRVTIYTIDGLGRRTQETIKASATGATLQTTVFEYNSPAFPAFITKKKILKGLVEASYLPEQVTTYTPDSRGRIYSETRGSGLDGVSLTSYTLYDGNNNTTQHTDPNARITTFQYDARNQLVRTNFPSVTNSEVNASGTVLASVSAFSQTAYNTDGTKKSDTNENGRVTEYAYDTLKRLIQATRKGPTTADNIVTETAYNSVGSITQQVDARSMELAAGSRYYTSFTYDGYQRPISQTLGAGPIETDFRGVNVAQTTTFEYDFTKNCGGSAFGNEGFKPTRTVDARSFITLTDYDSLYRVTRIQRQYGAQYTDQGATYDWVGNQLTETHKNQDTIAVTYTTSYQYDALNRLTLTTYHDATTRQQQYSIAGLPYRTIDELGRITTRWFDSAGRVTQEYLPRASDGSYSTTDSPITKYTYDSNSNVVKKEVRKVGSTYSIWEHTYDQRNRLTSTKNPSVYDYDTSLNVVPVSYVHYDSASNPRVSTDERGYKTTTTYDYFNRATQVTYPSLVPYYYYGWNSDGTWNGTVTSNNNASVVATGYDKNGNVVQVTDAHGSVTLNGYDRLNRLAWTKTNPKKVAVVLSETNDIITRFCYDHANNRSHTYDWEGTASRVVEHRYDGLNRLTKTVYPAQSYNSGGTTTENVRSIQLEYNAVVQTKRINARGQSITYTYDNRLRKKTETHVGRTQDNLTYNYDNAGNLLSVVNADTKRSVYYTYDALNRITTEKSADRTHSYFYDYAGNRTGVYYGSSFVSRQLSNAYDNQNRVTQVYSWDNTGGGSVATSNYYYDRAGNLRKLQHNNNTYELRTYDGRNQLTQCSLYNGAASLSVTNYNYDRGGNVTRLVETYPGGSGISDRTVLNKYDRTYRLGSESETVGTNPLKEQLFTYDKANNRIGKIVKVGGTTTVNATFDFGGTTGGNKLNQLQAVTYTVGGTNVTFSYDKDGNRYQETRGGQTNTFLYDYQNRLVQLTRNISPGTGTYYYDYDYRTRRVKRQEPSATNYVTFTGGVSAIEFTAGGSTVVEYVRGRDMGGGVGGVLFSQRGSTKTFSHGNGRGDITTRTNGTTGAAAWRATYEAFGTRTQQSGSDADRQRANSKEEDPTGLLNEGFRYRDLEFGIFLTRDPAGFVDGPNLYTYVRQNPWTKFDPLGLRDRTTVQGVTPQGQRHHKVPVTLWDSYGWGKGAQEFFDGDKNATTKSVLKTKSGDEAHNFTGHGEYNDRVEREMQDFLKENKVKDVSNLSARKQRELAEQLVNRLDNTNDEYIRGFNSIAGKGRTAAKKWSKSTGASIVKAQGRVADQFRKQGRALARWGGKALKVGSVGLAVNQFSSTAQAHGMGTAVKESAESVIFMDTLENHGERTRSWYEGFWDMMLGDVYSDDDLDTWNTHPDRGK